ncbi:ammonium transporter [Thalassoroseus pseudoceratinae]|uniref:ammonium transporter n=1 Tax=Thalassoroseus pseudoceratinae TaxID=2713176 RepID=UPI00142453C1
MFAQESNGNVDAESTQAKSEITAEPETSSESESPKQRADGFDGADTAWMLICSALVLMMTAPGLALFYGGLVRKKNILGVMMQCIFLMGTMSIVWALWGYSLAFGGHLLGGFVGDGTYLLMNNVLPYYDSVAGEAVYPMTGSIPTMVNMVFQMMFFIITPCLICGAFAERMKFSAMVVFSILWGTFVYCPIAHWVWGGGYFSAGEPMHAFDFAGGTVVHISSGVSALLCAVIIGKRLGFNQEPMPPHNLTYTCIGATMLWIGWFGFNAGSAVEANVLAANAFVATHMAAAAGVIAWAGAEWYFRGKPSILGACSGAVAGLVCITPASGTVTPLAAIALGLIAGLACFWACTSLKTKFGYDDSLDAFGVHGVGGTVGAILTGVFATRAVTGDNHPIGLLEGNAGQMGPQLISIVAAAGIALIGTFILLKVIDATIGLRVTQQDEMQGLDLSQHGEEGYIFL